jgi:hypothetical protein
LRASPQTLTAKPKWLAPRSMRAGTRAPSSGKTA